ncbi:biotin transporter BioY [Streptomyces sp. NPDC127068]|uniref:biotin transporter BioY n=1 Tax=Streptomyces sp. NPDC127068 TaxID=3347127 RepID=UPI003652B4B1
MTTSLSLPATRPGVLVDRLPGAALRDVLLVLGGATVTGLSAQFAFVTPLSPVPFTLQTLAVLLTSTALGAARGAAAMVVYLVAGAAGVPWFAGHSHGVGAPTFGYVVGFVLAAALVGRLAERGTDRRWGSTLAVMVAGNAVIHTVGATWLALATGLDVQQAFGLGVAPFLLTDALKIAFTVGALPLAWRLVHRD